MLTRDSILAARDFDLVEVDVPEWGGSVYLRGLSSRDRDRFEAGLAESNDMNNLRARLVVLALVDENGNRLFGDEEAAILGEKNAVVMGRLFDEVRNISGMSDEALGIAEGNLDTP